MTTAQKQSCMFVGIDVHKDTHTAVGISPYGEKLFEITVGNYQNDFETLDLKVKEHSGVLSPYIGLEDVRGYGERLAGYLYEKYPVYHVPSILVDRARQNATHPEKSDSLDALGVAKVMIQSIDTLLPYTISKESEKAKQLKEISIDREDLVLERTRLKNQVHTLLYRIYNTEYANKYKDPFALKALRFWSKAKPKCDPFLLKTMKRKVRRLLDIHVEVSDLEKDMDKLLTEGEELELGFKLVRDTFIFTSKRLILVDKQGITGSKTEFMSVAYKSISRFSIETAGTFDLDAELKIWVSSEAAPSITKKFNKSVDVYDVQKVLAHHVLK